MLSIGGSSTAEGQTPDCFSLRIQSEGNGRFRVAPTQSVGCEVLEYRAGQGITLTAIPDGDSALDVWTLGAGTVACPDCSLTTFIMPAQATTLSARFTAPACFPLTVAVIGSGAARSDPPQSLDCGAGEYLEGELVTLVATADEGSSHFPLERPPLRRGLRALPSDDVRHARRGGDGDGALHPIDSVSAAADADERQRERRAKPAAV